MSVEHGVYIPLDPQADPSAATATNRPRTSRLAACRDRQTQVEPVPAALEPVVVTATRRAERSFDVPASIDGATIRDGQPSINLPEPLVRVPGVFAANRGNYA